MDFISVSIVTGFIIIWSNTVGFLRESDLDFAESGGVVVSMDPLAPVSRKSIPVIVFETRFI